MTQNLNKNLFVKLNLTEQEITKFVSAEKDIKEKMDKAVYQILKPHRKLNFWINFLTAPIVFGIYSFYQVMWWVCFYYIMMRPRLDGMPLRVFLLKLYNDREGTMK